MGPYKLVALDMDGTVLSGDHTISETNRLWIRKALDAGVAVMFATGRGIQSVQPYIEDMRLQTPIVTVNGGEVWSRPHELHTRHPMETDWIRRLHKLAVEQDVWFWAYNLNGALERNSWTGEIDGNVWLKFGITSSDLPKLRHIRMELERWELFEISNSDLTNLEINPKGISKASGLRDVCAMLGIGMEHVVAVGDSLNDVAMIREAGLGVAMGNAQEAVKALADTVAPANNEDGVADVIRRYVFEQDVL